ncbi:unnamed protein product [Phaeothamnion confervicola]
MTRTATSRYPEGVIFEYAPNRTIPIHASDSDGAPFTGLVTASEGVVDWTGNYLDGRPHGEFRVYTGDRFSGIVRFEHGVRVDSDKVRSGS